MNKLQIFKNEEFGQVRILAINNESYFVGKDVAEILGYAKPRNAIATHVDEEDKKGAPIQGNLGGTQEMTIINESGLYSLILSSKLPTAKKFKRWVTSEVLPSIRKTGGYLGTNENMTDEEIMAKALLVAQNTINKKNELLKAKEEEIQVKEKELIETKEDLDNKNKFINQITISENSLLVREVAKIASKNGVIIGERRLWDRLRVWGFIFKNSTEAKQDGIDRGYFEIVEGSKTNKDKIFTYKTTRITGKGQIYIVNRLLKEAI
ncbi:UNVERIFIED_ORG: phage antirepressor Ant [Clostridium botulinum]